MRLSKIGLLCGVFISACFIGCGGGNSNGGGGGTPLAISTTSPLTSGTINVAYTATLSATGGTAPYTWSSSGTLPTGLTLSSAGVLSGTPTAVGSSSFSVTVTDSASPAATATLAAKLVVNDSTITITTGATLPVGMVGSPYSQTLAATGGTPPYTWGPVTTGTLPAGITLSSAGVLSGTPTAAGTFTFTIPVTDSVAGTASLAATLVINPVPALAITTTSPLPSGTTGTAYSGTFVASGGVAPYTWSIPAGSTLPAGLSLSGSGVLSGTPTTPILGSFAVTVADSEATPQTVTQTFSLEIDPAVSATPIPDGTYVFRFAGTSPQGTPAAENGVSLNGTFTIKSGTVLSGFYDENTNNGSLLSEQPITAGTLTNYTDGLGTLVLNVGATTSITFSLAIPATSGDIRIIEFDDTTGSGTRGSGILKAAVAPPTLPAAAGSFAFLVSATNSAQQQEALVCSFQTDGTGTNIVSLNADANEISGGTRSMETWTNNDPGSLQLDANGRGLLTFQLGASTFHFSFYEVSPTQWLVNSVDPVSANFPLASGTVYAQTGSGTFSVSSFPATSVLEANGLAPSSATTVPDIVAGISTSDGSGTLTFTYDEYNGTLATGQTLSGLYTVDPLSGRSIVASDATKPIVYIVDSSTALVLYPGNSALSGKLEEQSNISFDNTSFSGSYLGGSLALSNTDVLNEAGLVTADGAGNFTSVTNQSTSAGLTLYVNVAGTYQVDPTGRAVVIAPDGITRIFYIVTPGKVAYLTSDQGGYLGSFEQ